MTQRNNKINLSKKGSVEDAANALKQSQEGGKAGEDTGGGTTEDQGEKKPGESQTGTAGSEGAEAGQAGEGSEGGEQSGGSQEGGKAGEEDHGAGLEDLSDEVVEEIPTPVPDDAACEKFAKQLVKSPAHLEAFRKTLAIADSIVKSQSQGPLKTAEELQSENYLRLVNKYGKDFVTAERGTNKAYYSRKAWNGMKNKQGWAEVKRTMPEAAQASQTEK